MNDSIKKMLRLIEKDLMITEVSYETFQKKKTLIVDAVFSPAPHTCRNCGSTVVDGNGKVIVVKNGKKETIVRFEQYNHMPLVMRLKKQRYTCKNCRIPIGRLKVILFNPDIQSRIMSDIKLLLY
jgi:transposase